MQPTDKHRIGCEDFRRMLRMDRRGFLTTAMIGAAGLSLPELLRAEAKSGGAKSVGGRAPSVIILWMRGGPSHIDVVV